MEPGWEPEWNQDGNLNGNLSGNLNGTQSMKRPICHLQPLEKVLFFINLAFFLRNQKYQLYASFLDFQKTFKERNFLK